MQADALSTTLFALADPTRRAIVARLATGDATVTQLAEPYDMTVAAISKHLKVLEGAGLVSRSKDAQRRPCHLEGRPLRAVSAWLADYRRFWDRSLDSLEEHLGEMQRAPRPRSKNRTPRSSARSRKDDR